MLPSPTGPEHQQQGSERGRTATQPSGQGIPGSGWLAEGRLEGFVRVGCGTDHHGHTRSVTVPLDASAKVDPAPPKDPFGTVSKVEACEQ